MWISKQKLLEWTGRAYDDGLKVGYQRGYQAGQIEARNRMLVKPIEKQIKEEGDGKDLP